MTSVHGGLRRESSKKCREATHSELDARLRGHDDGEVASLLVVELAMPTHEPKRREKQAKSFAAPIFPRTAVRLRGNDGISRNYG
jgi:hypothetical protein